MYKNTFKYLFILLSFLSILEAKPILVTYDTTDIENFEIQYFIDKSSALSFDDIQKEEFQVITNTNSFFGNVGTVWYKLGLKNQTVLDRQLFLHNDYAYFSKEIIIYFYKNNNYIDQTKYSISQTHESNKLIGSTLLYPFLLKAKSVGTIYIKNTPMISPLFNLKIYDERHSLLSLTNKTFLSNSIIFILLTLALYNIMLFLFNKRKEFIYYALYLINASVGFVYFYGSLYNNLYIYGEITYWFNLSAILVSFFLALFIRTTFQTKELHKKIDKLLLSLIYLTLINLLIALFYDLKFAMKMLHFTFTYSFLIMIYFAYYLLKSQHYLAKIFITAYTIYILGMSITLLSMSNLIALNFFTFHASGIGIVIEALLFSYLIYYHIHRLEQEIRTQKELIITKNKKAQLGDMISAITHQWKQPLARIASITTLMQFKITKNKIITTEEIEQKLDLVNSNVSFLNETIDDFKDFFQPNATPREEDITKIIQKSITISMDDTLHKEIIIKTDICIENKILTYKNELIHILLNIIQNAKEALINNSVNIPMIKIMGYTKDTKVYIDIIDNAGGIKKENLPLIFNENYTTKEVKNGNGLGLYLTKVILEEHLKSSIEAIPIKNGTMFRIIL